MIESNNLQVTASFGEAASICLGNEKTLTFNVSNLSTTEKAYNVSAEITLGDSFTLISSTPSYTNIGKGSYTIRNFKDFAALEEDIPLEFNLHSELFNPNGKAYSFGESFDLSLKITWHSMPRGEYDEGDIEYYSIYSFKMTVEQLEIFKSLPAKQLKGEGEYFYTSTITITNNLLEETLCSFIDYLPNGFSYFSGSFSYSASLGTIINAPTTTLITETGELMCDFGRFTLKAGEVLVITFSTSIYEKYTLNGIVNSGGNITHNHVLEGRLECKTYEIIETLWVEISIFYYAYSIKAMNIILTLVQNLQTVDVGYISTYSLNLALGAYYAIGNIILKLTLPDGITPINYEGFTLTTANGISTLTNNIGTLEQNATYSIDITGEINQLYSLDESLVCCGDSFDILANLTCTNLSTNLTNIDSASTSQSIILPNITKTIIGKTYRDGTDKLIPALAPLDYITYELRYSGEGIKASQKNIVLDDFFPLDTIVPTADDIEQIAGESVEFLELAPHGLRWELGNQAGDSLWVINIKNQIGETISNVFPRNLFKLTGENSKGKTYSLREKVMYLMGTPNITCEESITGIDIKDVTSGERFTTSLTYYNSQNSDENVTDAFNFNISHLLDLGIVIDETTIAISGTGSWGEVKATTESINLPIESLMVNEYIRVSFQATLPENVPPDYNALFQTTIDVPYTQIYSETEVNVLYDTTEIIKNIRFKSAKATMLSTYDVTTKEVGDNILNYIEVTIPAGTASFNSQLVIEINEYQNLPLVGKINGEEVALEIIDNTITFPAIDYVGNMTEASIITFEFVTTVADTPATSTEDEQINYLTFLYNDEFNNNYNLAGTGIIIVSNPLLACILSSLTNDLSASKTSTITMNIANIGNVNMGEFYLNIPIGENINFQNAYTSRGTFTYNETDRLLTFYSSSLTKKTSFDTTIQIIGVEDIRSDDVENVFATSSTYKNQNEAGKTYKAINSNVLSFIVEAGTLLTIYPPLRNQNGHGYIQVTANSTAYVPYTIVNTGGGIDSYNLSITASKYPYDIRVNNEIVLSVPAGVAINEDLTAFSDIRSGQMLKFTLIFAVPQVQLYDENPYTVTITSLSDENASMHNNTYMIDP